MTRVHMTMALAVLAGGGGCLAREAMVQAPHKAPAQPETAPVAGTVVDRKWGRALPDQIVVLDGQRATTDVAGRFSFARAPARYDLTILSPNGKRATIYQGLSRRDPRLVHTAARTRSFAHRARIMGMVLGGLPPGASVDVQFAAPGAAVKTPRPAFGAAPTADFGPITVSWDGADTLAGRMVVLLRKDEKAKEIENDHLSAWYAQKSIRLAAGQTVTVDLKPAPVPVVRRPFPSITRPKGNTFGSLLEYHEHYEIPGSGWALWGDGMAPEVADLRAFDVELCGEARAMDPWLPSSDTACGFPLTEPRSVPLVAPPAFTTPPWGTVAVPGLRFAWSGAPGAIYRLSIGPAGSRQRALEPTIDVITAKTEARWPDLSALGLPFPRPPAAYAATIEMDGPYASIDEATAPAAASAAGRRRWSSGSQQHSIPVYPPLGKEEAACPDRSGVVCATGGVYQLTAMNRKIRRYPAFANAVGIHCVRDCAGAEAFMTAYGDYLRAHPGFDDNEPQEPFPPEVPPPADGDEGAPP
jgi:hypothetical protein